MSYKVSIKRSAEKEMDCLPPIIHKRISNKILSLSKNPRPTGHTKLTASEGYRIRMGSYRVLYTIDDRAKHVLIYSVGHRKEIYRGRH